MALAMILIQQNEQLNPRVQIARTTFDKIISDRHEEAMAKFGASVAQGLIDAGGRNATIGLRGRGGSSNTSAIVGMALFTQYWYWFPMAHFASLAFTPTAMIGVTKSLELPALEFVSHAPPSLFAYPPHLQGPSEKKPEKVETAVLSTTAKSQARQRTKEKKKAAADSMDTDETSKPEEEEPVQDKPQETAKEQPKEEHLPNGSRVTPFQLKYVTLPSESRYSALRPLAKQTLHDLSSARELDMSATASRGGILLLYDQDPSAPFVPAKPKPKEDETMDHEAAAKALAATSDDDNNKAQTGVKRDDDNEKQEAPSTQDVEMDEQAR